MVERTFPLENRGIEPVKGLIALYSSYNIILPKVSIYIKMSIQGAFIFLMTSIILLPFYMQLVSLYDVVFLVYLYRQSNNILLI